MLPAKHFGGSLKKKFKEYEQPWHIQKFEPVRAWICEVEEEIKKYLELHTDQNRHLAHVVAVLDQVSCTVFPSWMYGGALRGSVDRTCLRCPVIVFSPWFRGGLKPQQARIPFRVV